MIRNAHQVAGLRSAGNAGAFAFVKLAQHLGTLALNPYSNAMSLENAQAAGFISRWRDQVGGVAELDRVCEAMIAANLHRGSTGSQRKAFAKEVGASSDFVDALYRFEADRDLDSSTRQTRLRNKFGHTFANYDDDGNASPAAKLAVSNLLAGGLDHGKFGTEVDVDGERGVTLDFGRERATVRAAGDTGGVVIRMNGQEFIADSAEDVPGAIADARWYASDQATGAWLASESLMRSNYEPEGYVKFEYDPEGSTMVFGFSQGYGRGVKEWTVTADKDGLNPRVVGTDDEKASFAEFMENARKRNSSTRDLGEAVRRAHVYAANDPNMTDLRSAFTRGTIHNAEDARRVHRRLREEFESVNVGDAHRLGGRAEATVLVRSGKDYTHFSVNDNGQVSAYIDRTYYGPEEVDAALGRKVKAKAVWKSFQEHIPELHSLAIARADGADRETN